MLKNIILLFIIFSLPFCMRGEEKCRIISLSPAVTEIICHLGGEKYLVGRSSACDYPESVKKLPVAGDFAKPYMEKILSLRPHYLLTNDLINPVVAKKLTSFGIKCIMKQTTGKDEYFFWVEIIGKILKKEKEATLEIRRVNSILSDLQKRIAGRKKKKVLWIIWDSPLMVAGEKAFPDSMIRYAGGVNIAGNVKSDYFKCSPEWMAQRKMDLIIFPGLSSKKKKELSRRYPWNTLEAWQKNAVLPDIPEELLLRPGPRFTEGALLLHNILYP